MAKLITFTDMTTPTGLTLSLISGGTLKANTTYYYRVQSVKYTRASVYTWNGKSLPSSEVAITTDSTNLSVQLVFNVPKGEAGSYRIFRSETPYPNYVDYYKPLVSFPFDSTDNVAGVVTWVDTGVSIGSNCFLEFYAHGQLNLTGSTSSDPFSIVDLYNADVAGGWGVVRKLDNQTYSVGAYIYGHTNMYWKDEAKTIIFRDGMYDSAGATYTFGRISGEKTSAGCHIISKASWLATLAFNTLYAYQTSFEYIWTTFSSYTSSYGLGAVTFHNGLVQDCSSTKFRNFLPYNVSTCTIKNFTMTNYDSAFQRGYGTFINVRVMSGSRPFQTGGNSVINARGVYADGANFAGVMLIGYNNIVNFVNCVFVSPMPTARALNDSTGSVVQDQFSYNLTVLESGTTNPIVSANVKITDSTGSVIVNTTTDINGVLVEQIITRLYITALVKVLTTINKSPYIVEISKTGYETYRETVDYLTSDAIVKTLSLKPSVSIHMDIEGNIYSPLTPVEGSSSKIIKI